MAAGPDVHWMPDRARSGRYILTETAFFSGLVLVVSGMRAGWGIVLAPPDPAAPETWSWRVERPGGAVVVSGLGLRSQGEAREAAVRAAHTQKAPDGVSTVG